MDSKDAKFRFGASLRIMDVPSLHSEITSILGKPLECHVKGELVRNNDKKRWPNDMWMIKAKVSEDEDINKHIAWLTSFINPHKGKVMEWISKGARVDIYMFYDCDEEHRGFAISPSNLSIFPELGIQLSVSVMR